MTSRSVLIKAFLAGSRWESWHQTALAGDASSRRYLRLTSGDETVILMDDPPSSGATTSQFAAVATYLSSCGLCPPHIHAHDPSLGLMIISDLGEQDFARWLIQRPKDSDMLYRAAADVLLHLKSCPPPDGLTEMTPDIGAEMVRIVGEKYAGKPADDLMEEIRLALRQLAPCADTLALRDFHAENLIWRPAMTGHSKIGLLDFQDAFIAPEGYDLVSLLRDARRDVAPTFYNTIVSYYIDRSGQKDTFRAQLACLGVQRNLRILGVFARLARDQQKPHYLSFIPRVWQYLQEDLSHPKLAAVRRVADATLPPPSADHLKGLAS
ncbi:MAG: phosphotransferase [Pseudomonadota bacterium]